MKEETKTIGEQIVEINSKLEALDEEKGRLITLHTSLENEEKAVKEKEWQEKVTLAGERKRRVAKGRREARFGLANKQLFLRKERRARTTNDS